MEGMVFINSMTENKMVLDFADKMKSLTNPDEVVWITGIKEQFDKLRAQALATGELIELTDFIYVVLNMDIMTRIGKPALDMLGDSNYYVRGMHSKCDLDPEKRYILHFPEDNAIWSMNSGYGGNVLLGKKCKLSLTH